MNNKSESDIITEKLALIGCRFLFLLKEIQLAIFSEILLKIDHMQFFIAKIFQC